MVYYVFKSMTISSFASVSISVIVFFFCLHFCLLSHFEMIKCILKSMIATSSYFLLKYTRKNETWKVFFKHQSLGA